MKKFISILLVVATLICILPASAFADNDSWWDKITGKTSKVAEDVADKAKDVAEVVADKAKDATEDVSAAAGKAKTTAKDVAKDAADAAGKAYNSAKNTISKISLPDFKRGWENAASFLGSTVASLGSQQYVSAVTDAIDKTQSEILSRVQNSGSTIASKAGFVAEEWHSGTYNIDAIAKGLKIAASTDKSNGMASVDVSISDGTKASMKYYANADASAKQQAKNILEKYNEYAHNSSNPMSLDEWTTKNGVNWEEYKDLYWSVYKDQVRVIPSDQLDDAKACLEKAIKKESAKDGANRRYIAEADKETLKNLKDRLETADGTQSVPLSKEEAEAIARAGQNDDFNIREFEVKDTKTGKTKVVNEATAIKGSYIAKQALKAGTTSAIIEAAVVVGPQIFEIIKHLIDTGELDSEQLKSVGIDGLTAASDGFLKGSISSALVIACQSGKLGTQYTHASPELIGTLTVFVIDAIRCGIKMANGQITTAEYADIMAQEFIVGAVAYGAGAAIGLLFPGATLAICIGSFVGGLVASAGYPAGKEIALALINDAEIDLLVPISSTALSIKDKSSALSLKITDALKDIKNIDLTLVKDKTIRVFDFTNKI